MTGAHSIADLPSDLAWRKSSHSAVSNCLEIASLPDGGGVALRTSREPRGMALVLTPGEWRAALAGAKDGEFDDLL